MIVLGIDPDRGWALCEHGMYHRIIAAGSEKGIEPLTEKIRRLSEEYSIDQARIERPPNKHVHDRPGQSAAAMRKIAVDVGENRAKAEMIFWFCNGLGLLAVFTNPVRNGTKLSAKQIEQLTGWTGRTNEHARDAIVIAWC